MNYWLLTVCIAAPFTLLVANFSIVQAWGAKAEEANILPKFLVVLGILESSVGAQDLLEGDLLLEQGVADGARELGGVLP